MKKSFTMVGLAVAAVAVGSAFVTSGGGSGVTASARPAAVGASALTAADVQVLSDGDSESGAALRNIPAALKVPDPKAKPVAVLRGVGDQVYTCASGKWTLLEPAAILYQGSKAVGLHTRGPVWVSTVDGSAVTGSAVASVPQKGAVPELLLKASSNRGTGTFGKVTYIQRLDTSGGLAPAGQCGTAGQQAVPYSAFYVFYVG